MKIYYIYNKIILIQLILNFNNNFNSNFKINCLNCNNINFIINFINYLNNNNNNFYYILLNIIKYGKKMNLLNSFNKKKYFKYINFANINNVNLKNLKIHNDSYYSITNYYDANYITNLIYKYYNKKNIIITDATANIGGNTISFGLFNYKFINSVEIEELCYNYLINNINCYNLKNIKAYHNNYLDIYLKLYQDVVFLDPPWGGPEYKKENKLDLFLDNINIINIINTLFLETLTTSIILKAPFNYNKIKLINKIKNNKNISINIYKLSKYNIIYLFKDFKKIEI
tara:strand:- start:1984 stop:2841 length:858 start_codon:yes stop_codon:yes gene_type:complete